MSKKINTLVEVKFFTRTRNIPLEKTSATFF